MKNDPDYKNAPIPYGLVIECLDKMERLTQKQIERNKRGQSDAGDDIIRKAMHSGKMHAHLLDLDQIRELKNKVEKYNEARKIPRNNSLSNKEL